MIHYILRNVAQAEQGTAHVQLGRHTGSHVHVVSDSFHFRCVNEVSRADCFTNHVVIVLT